MKKFAFLFAGLLLATATAWAADTAPARSELKLSRFSLGAFLSYWNSADLDEFDLDGALGGGIIGRFRLGDFLALETRLSGYGAGETRDVSVQGEGYFEHTTTLVVMPLEAGLVACLPLGDTFRLYGGPGVGFYLYDGEFTSEQGPRETTLDLDLDDDGGFYALLGAGARLARNAEIFLEGKYTWTETQVTNAGGWLEAGEEIDFSGLALSAGMIFTF